MVQQGEAKLVNEWLRLNHPQALQWKRVRLGPLPNKQLSQLFKVAQRWADAIYLEDDVIHIVEAKVRPTATAIGQLELYRELFPDTPEFSQFRGKAIKLIFLTTADDVPIRRLCDEKGIEYVVFAPEFIVRR